MQGNKNQNSDAEQLRHTKILEGADIGTWEWNIQTDEIFYNEKWASIIGYTLDELQPLTPNTWKKLTHPEDIETVIEQFQDYLDGKSSTYLCEFRMQHKNGKWIWICDKGKIVSWTEDGKIEWVTGMHVDITERKELETSIKKQADFQDLLLNIASTYINIDLGQVDGVIRHSLEEMANFVEADRAYIFDYDFNKSTTSNTYEWCADGITKEIDTLQNLSMDIMPQWLSKHLNGEILYIPDVSELPAKGNHDLYANLEHQRIKSLITIPLIHGDSLLGFVGFDFVKSEYHLSGKEIKLLTLFANMLVNIQERRNKDIKLNTLLSISQNQNEKLKNFAHILSHNIRSHSSNISMILALIADEYPELNEFQLVKLLVTASDKLSETIRHLNKVILINTTSPEKLTSIKLFEIVEHTLRTLTYMAKNEGVIIENNIEPNTTVYGVESYLDSILMNLITNGIKYSSDDKESKILLFTEKSNGYTVLHVKDNGLGIDLDKNHDKIFGMYKTFHEHPDSRGVGLFITKNQVEAMGGKIEVESEVGEGSTFKVYLPYEE